MALCMNYITREKVAIHSGIRLLLFSTNSSRIVSATYQCIENVNFKCFNYINTIQYEMLVFVLIPKMTPSKSVESGITFGSLHQESKSSIQIYIFLKNLLLSKFPPLDVSKITSLFTPVEYMDKVKIISKVLKDTESSTLHHSKFWEFILSDETLQDVIHDMEHTTSIGYTWRNSLLNRNMSEQVKLQLIQMSHWDIDAKDKKLQKSQRRTKFIQTSSLTGHPLEKSIASKTGTARRKIVGFDEIRFNNSIDKVSHPSAFKDESWKYLTQKERKMITQTVKRNHKRLEQQEAHIIELIGKQRTLSQDQYDALDKLAESTDPRLNGLNSLELLFNQLLDKFKSTSISGKLEFMSDMKTSTSQTEIQKQQEGFARLLFSWIVFHIDIQAPNERDDDDGETTEEILQDYIAYSSKGVATLFKDLCQLAKIECILVEGKFRNPLLPFPQCIREVHGWNVCKIGLNYRLVDCTWPFEYGFFMEPHQFLQSHFPSQPFINYALISKDSIPSTFEEWVTQTPNYSTPALQSKVRVLHKNHELYLSTLESCNRTVMKISNLSINTTKIRVYEIADDDMKCEIPFACSLEQRLDEIIVYLCFPKPGTFIVEISIPKTPDIVHIEDIKYQRQMKILNERRQMREAEEARKAEQEESMKSKKNSKVPKKIESETADAPSIQIPNPSLESHMVATIRSIIVPKGAAIPFSDGYPMPVLSNDIFPISHPLPVIEFDDKEDSSSISFKFLTRLEMMKPKITLIPEMEVVQNGKKVPEKKGKPITSVDLENSIINQKCPISILAREILHTPAELIDSDQNQVKYKAEYSLGYTKDVDDRMIQALQNAHQDAESPYHGEEFVLPLSSGLEGRELLLEWTNENAPIMKYKISIKSTITLSAPSKIIIPKVSESSYQQYVYTPLPFAWKFVFLHEECLTRVYIDGKKPIECSTSETDPKEWIIPEQKKGTFKILGTLPSGEFELFEISI